MRSRSRIPGRRLTAADSMPHWRKCVGAMCLVLIACGSDLVVDLDRPVPELHIGRPFQAVLNARISATWDNVDLRTVLQRITDQQQISILRDRRIDPDRRLAIDIENLTVSEALEKIAAAANADVAILGNTAYVAPSATAAQVRTLSALRSREVFDSGAGVESGRQFSLAKRAALHWNDLDRPADILNQIAATYQLTITNADVIPHDLWAGNTLPQVDAIDALTLVLAQFDCTFEWTNGGNGVRIVPIPERVWMERRHVPRRMAADAAADQWRSAFDGIEAEPDGRGVIVRGTVEQHEAIAALLRPEDADNKTAANRPAPLQRRLFSLQVQAVPVRAIMNKLAESDIVFEFDERELRAAGIDLNRRIDLNVNQVSAAEFFRELFGAFDMSVTFDELTVTLKPK